METLAQTFDVIVCHFPLSSKHQGNGALDSKLGNQVSLR